MKKLLIIIAALTAMVTLATTRSKKADISRNLDTFNSLYKELQTFYVDSIDAEKSIQIAIDAMLNDIDPYTEYIPGKEQSQFMTMTTGEYGGIGSYILERNGGTYISGPYQGSPAAEAGLRPGDHIIMIDDDSVATWPSSKVSDKLKGQAGTKLRVTVNRPYVEDSILTFEIVRRKIQMPSVPYHGMLDDQTGYIALTGFTDKSYQEVRDALTDLLKNQGAKSLILDLRGNGGGLLESAVQILGLFLPKGTKVLTTKGKETLSEKTYKTTVAPLDTKLPIAVLIDGGTASSAEIVSGALQDLDRATIIGSRSFGKGLVQTTRQLPYDGLLKVTVAKYYIPSGRLIQAIDYGKRDENGYVSRTPDSLTSVFHTLGGREVRDGGGITPDIKIEYPDVTRLAYNAVRDNWIFDFANQYRAKHDTITSPWEFVVSDTLYSQFVESIDPSKFNYDKPCELALNQLRQMAKTEGYMNDSTAAQFDVLAGLLKHDLKHDFDVNRKLLSPYLANEILSRYYFNRGQIIYSLRDDAAVDSARNIFRTAAKPKK